MIRLYKSALLGLDVLMKKAAMWERLTWQGTEDGFWSTASKELWPSV